MVRIFLRHALRHHVAVLTLPLPGHKPHLLWTVLGNDDEYQATFVAPAAGSYRYAYRFSVDGGSTWTYCDANGSGSNAGLSFEMTHVPALTVTAAP